MPDIEYRILYELYPDQFRKIVSDALLAYFNSEIRASYHVTGWAQMPDGMWVVKLERDVLSKQKEGTHGTL